MIEYWTRYVEINKASFISVIVAFLMLLGGTVVIFCLYNFVRCVIRLICKLCGINLNTLQNQSDYFLSASDKGKFYLFILARIFLIACADSLVYMIVIIGIYPLPFYILLLAIGVLVQNLVYSKVKNKSHIKILNLSMKDFNTISLLPLYYYLAYLALGLGQQKLEIITSHAIKLALVGPCLLVLFQSLTSEKSNQNTRFDAMVIEKVDWLKGKYLYIVVAMLLCRNIIPNAGKMVIYQRYVSHWVIKFAISYIFLLAIVLAYFIVKRIPHTIQNNSHSQRLKAIKVIILFSIIIYIHYLAGFIENYHTKLIFWHKIYYNYAPLGLSSLFYTLCRSSSTEPYSKALKLYYIELGLILLLAFNYLKHSYLYIEMSLFPQIYFQFIKIMLSAIIMHATYSIFYHESQQSQQSNQLKNYSTTHSNNNSQFSLKQQISSRKIKKLSERDHVEISPEDEQLKSYYFGVQKSNK